MTASWDSDGFGRFIGLYVLKKSILELTMRLLVEYEPEATIILPEFTVTTIFVLNCPQVSSTPTADAVLLLNWTPLSLVTNIKEFGSEPFEPIYAPVLFEAFYRKMSEIDIQSLVVQPFNVAELG